MEIKLEQNLEHQWKPVEGVARIVEQSEREPAAKSYQNPTLPRGLFSLPINRVRRDHGLEKRHDCHVDETKLPEKVRTLPHHSILDIKMETGTGKTYVYTRTMLELHKRCGYNKFIIAVPTLPIKAGTAAFIGDPAVRRHFSQVCEYHTDIVLCLLEPQKKKTKGRPTLPSAVRSFFQGNNREKNKIYVLLLNTQLLTSGKLLTRDDYFTTLGTFRRPIDAIRDTHPVLIIDEPHRMPRSSTSYAALINGFAPQFVLRYGATFPTWTFGKGKNKHTCFDYANLIYDLNAAEAFNQGLIKGVAKEHLELPGEQKADKKVKVVSVERGNNTHLHLISDKESRTFELHAGDSLGTVDPDLNGISIEAITKNSIVLSNGQEKQTGEEFYPDQFAPSYQEAMMALALKRHFETERVNFCRGGLRIKTLALFFIDNIESFRGPEGKNNGWLRTKFLQLLKERVEKELSYDNPPRYEAYLRATLDHLDDTCAGYFSRDNNDSDDNIAQEVETILHGKKELLSFTRPDGSPNVLRFLFSKWTLKEGWDNPNVFTICKLRSSGSETSKLQEVGRGLRLPVDEAGNRISGDDVQKLNYIVDFTERDFAEKLVREINSEVHTGGNEQKKPMVINFRLLGDVAKQRGMDEKTLFIDLLQKGYVDLHYNIVYDRKEALFEDYPEFKDETGGVSDDKVTDRNQRSTGTVHIRKARFEELRTLWAQLNRKYVLYIDKDVEGKLRAALPGIIKDREVFSLQTFCSNRSEIVVTEDLAKMTEDYGTYITVPERRIGYSEFLRRASEGTNVPLPALHQAVCEAVAAGYKIEKEMVNESSLARLIVAVNDWKSRQMAGYVRYRQADYTMRETKLTNADGSVRDDVVQAYIGRKLAPGEPPAKYLYDRYAYDSDLELCNMKADIEEVIVYGKIPAKSICIPTVASSNYSPDFMYVVRRRNGSKELNVIIETKAYDQEAQVSQDEEAKITCAEAFFKEMTAKGFTVHFRKQINSKSVKEIINDLIKG